MSYKLESLQIFFEFFFILYYPLNLINKLKLNAQQVIPLMDIIYLIISFIFVYSFYSVSE